uniref:ER membrane protein complex subunit 1 n=2 Tax=Drosophila melanogaster TaxID=7227 RepID=A0A0B4LGV1_DROME|nr:ER membrane protein complex subunit 1, isoform C [Drosophila melanogaster]NP_001287217.1 ER membrane protein complex subunit 1, isoform D [Drosophila melanogaster]AHN57215.1 ER membrane protein complex subunit 1, isoform C [Drosophila melanogaster]AHN57216.1 ER membrane protein complex subunit 1, isoform D [Drosophila melanogaster]|eukprot:NP_001287216.1 ER membrane protein complex 1, isoform C [Drosophila melanogaster]
MQEKWLLPALSLALLLGTCSALYEDQIKKFDWRGVNVGALKQSRVDLNHFQPRILVTTYEGVVASLCVKTGELVWRQVLEQKPRGDVKLLQVSGFADDSSDTAAAPMGSNMGFDMLTVQGHAPALVRGWNTNMGALEWEWSIMPMNTERAQDAMWIYSKSVLYHVLPAWRSHLEVTAYFASSGHSTGSTSKVIAPWITSESCTLSGTFYVCTDGKQLISLDLVSKSGQVIRTSLEAEPKGKTQALTGLNGVVIVDGKPISVNKDQSICGDLRSSSFAVGSFNYRKVLAYADLSSGILRINALYLDNCAPAAELEQSLPFPEHFGTPSLSNFDCKQKRNGEGKNCLFLFSSTSESIVAVQHGRVRWSREESLANVIDSQFVDLPLADTEGTLENEMKGKAGDIASAFLRRITTQAVQIRSLFLHVIGLGPPPTDTQRAGLVRDSFGLHKMLVLLTRAGKIFGIDNVSGKHHWQLHLPNVIGFANDEQMRLIVQRSAKHFPLQPLCTILGKNAVSGNGVLYRFNPITGKVAEGGLVQLDYRIKQLSLLGETEKDFLKGILLLDASNKVHVYPEHAAPLADGMYLYTADLKTAELAGYFVKYAGGQLSSTHIWNARLGGHNSEQQIIGVAGKNPIEHVHSQGRVLGDRSVLYKYINPNLVAFVTQAPDSTHKSVLNLYLVDVVSGSVVFTMTHRKVRAPLSIVHSENWLAYSYFNEKLRRTEITTIELYEGKSQANSSVWSSLQAPPMPLVERQSYILPTIVEALRETITERGITNKHVLIGTASGSIVEMPWHLLDPRRPIASTTQGREEGAIPYIPELPLPTESHINYNQTVARLRNIYTAPSGLESTCLVVATGLDLFVTRVAPSKTFDLLKEDFDYILISIVLVALTSGSLIVKHLASRKLLKQAWK